MDTAPRNKRAPPHICVLESRLDSCIALVRTTVAKRPGHSRSHIHFALYLTLNLDVAISLGLVPFILIVKHRLMTRAVPLSQQSRCLC